MARDRGSQSDGADNDREGPEEDIRGGIPQRRLRELLRQALGYGFSGLFLTEEALRRALGDTLPRDWVTFAAEQSERTRTEFLERLAGELARSLETIDLATLLDRLLSGRTVEVKARLRLLPRDAAEEKEDGGVLPLELRLAPRDRRR